MHKKINKNNANPQPLNGIEIPQPLNGDEITQPLDGQATDIPMPNRLSNEKLI